MPIGTQRNGQPASRNNKARSPYNRAIPRRGGSKPNTVSAGNAKRQYERYLELARAAASTGDTAEIENFYQHAEHYFRVMREQTA